MQARDATGKIPPSPAHSNAIASAARALLDGIPAARPFLRDWPDATARRPTVPRTLPVLAWLDAARTLTVPSTAPLVEALAAAGVASLDWRQTYTEAEVDPAFLARYGWTELIGSRGPIPSEAIACGILMLGPDTHYPPHAHAAEELYVPLAGSAAWTRGDEGDVEHLSGAAIHHPPWVPHAMRTGAEPLLALYVWRGGDLAVPSRIIARA